MDIELVKHISIDDQTGIHSLLQNDYTSVDRTACVTQSINRSINHLIEHSTTNSITY